MTDLNRTPQKKKKGDKKIETPYMIMKRDYQKKLNFQEDLYLKISSKVSTTEPISESIIIKIKKSFRDSLEITNRKLIPRNSFPKIE